MNVFNKYIKRKLKTYILYIFGVLCIKYKGILSESDLSAFFSKHGYYLFKKHFYLPIPSQNDLRYIKKSKLSGLAIDLHKAFKFFNDIVLPYRKEYLNFPLFSNNSCSDFFVINGNFMSGDSFIYYSLIRHLNPRTIIEVGSGYSSLLAAIAIKQNVANGLRSTKLICIDPYPKPFLSKIPSIRLLATEVQNINLQKFQTLQSGDILFIDSSHVMKPGGDIWWLYCEVLPTLKSGVFVHIHDFELPHPYPKEYFAKNWFWTEQYIVQTFLSFNNRFEILLPVSLMLDKYGKKITKYFQPEYSEEQKKYTYARPSSLWLRVN